MATTVFFEETIKDQDDKTSIDLEFGRSSFYSGCDVANGVGEDSIYLRAGDTTVLMDRATAKKFVDAVVSVGTYFSLVD